MTMNVKDRTLVTIIAIISLTTLAVVAIIAQRDTAIIAPMISAVLILAGYEGVKQIEERNGDG